MTGGSATTPIAEALMRPGLWRRASPWTSSLVSYTEMQFYISNQMLATTVALSSGIRGSSLVDVAKETARYSVSTVERALVVLRAFTYRQPELSPTDIAAATGLHKATVFRLLATLCNGGVTLKDSRTGLYR